MPKVLEIGTSKSSSSRESWNESLRCLPNEDLGGTGIAASKRQSFIMEQDHYPDPSLSSSDARYLVHGKLGEGAFGDVRLGTDRETGKKVALKYIRVLSKGEGLPRAVFREVEALRQLREGAHIVRLLDVFPDESNLCLALEYHPSDLSEVISQARDFIPVAHVKAYAQMLLEALSYMHARHIIHRDVKPSNVLLSSTGAVKLADFGLARVLPSTTDNTCGAGPAAAAPTPDPAARQQDLSHQVATRWYRPPELLFASRNYSFSADVWSAGVVVAELFSLQPLFPGTNDIDQMFRVFQIMGSPTPECWSGVGELPDYNKVSFPGLRAIDFGLVIPRLQAADAAFLRTMLVLDPARRVTAAEVCTNEYFNAHPLPVQQAFLECPTRAVPSAQAGAGRNDVKSIPQLSSSPLEDWEKEDLRLSNVLSQLI